MDGYDGRIEVEVDQRLPRAERRAELLERAMAELGADREHDVGRPQRAGGGAAIGQHAVPE